MFGKSTRIGRKSTHSAARARSRRRTLNLEGLEDRRLLAGLVADGSQVWHHGMSEIPNGSIAAIGGVEEVGDKLGSAFATGDFNRDGFADVAIGAPQEAIGSIAGAGAVNVIYGSASGLTGGSSHTVNQLWYQGVSGVADTPEHNDQFGRALVAGDFNGDTYDDLAIGVPGEDNDAGAVQILLGSESRLTASGGRQIISTDPQFNLSGSFGAALATGRFGNSNTDELVIGAPTHDANGESSAGAVVVVRFEPGSLLFSDVQIWSQDSPGLDDSKSESDDLFGGSLAVGDFNGDTYDDLAIGAHGEDEEGFIDFAFGTGAVNVIHGSLSGLTSANNQVWWQDSDGVPGSNHSADHYGATLASGDFDGDGFDDLAISAWEDGGWVNIIYGAPIFGLSDASQHFDQNSPGIAGVRESFDFFGGSLAAADFNADGYDDLAIGVPGEDWNATNNGAIHLIYGSSDGLKAVNTAPGSAPQLFSAEHLSGFTFDNMVFGGALAAADFDADGHADLMVGMPGLGGGKAYAMFGNATGLTDAAGGHQYWHQNIAGSTSSLENGARFGKQLATGDFNGDGRDDLAIGVPGRDLPFEQRWDKSGAGVVNVLYGDAAGTFATEQPPQLLHQDMLDDPKPVLRGAASFEGFGSTLAVGDFNADGFDDLVVGSPFESVGGMANVGAIHIVFGTPNGLDPSTSVMLFQDPHDPDLLPGEPMAGDQLGSALATGDFDLDGIDDIAVGIPHKDVINRVDAGMVKLLYGSPVRIDGEPNPDYHVTALVASEPVAGDRFGWSLAIGNVLGNDAANDLAVGMPGIDVGNAEEAGAVAVFEGMTGFGILFTQDPVMVIEDLLSDSSEANDNFGYTLTMGDFDRDGFDDLVIGTPFEDLEHDDNGLQIDAGAVTVVPGSANGLNVEAHQFWHQDLDENDPTEALGIASLGKHFGYSLAAGDFNADQHDDLTIGVPNESFASPIVHLRAGRVIVIDGAEDGLDEGAQQWWNGTTESDGYEDHFGLALETGDFNGDGADDLAVGAPEDDMPGFIDVGAVHTILGEGGVIFFDPGDFDQDGDLTCTDIDMLTAEAASGVNTVGFDLTDDGLVNVDDVGLWVVELKGTSLGDANLDGLVDDADFHIWNANKFTAQAAWCRGDFNADGFVDGFDLLIWSANRTQPAGLPAVDPNDPPAPGEAEAFSQRNVDAYFAAADDAPVTSVTQPLAPWSRHEERRSSLRSVQRATSESQQLESELAEGFVMWPSRLA